MKITIEEGAVEAESWVIDSEGTSLTWSDVNRNTVMTKEVGYSLFSSTPVEDLS